MSAIEIGAELDLVDGDELGVEVARHRLDRGDPVTRPARLDLLFAGDKGDSLGSDLLDDPVVDLASEQPQRQTDDPGRMRQHPLDREMRLAGVGWTKDCGNGAGSNGQISPPFFGPREGSEQHRNESRPNRRLDARSRLFTPTSAENTGETYNL